jgi:RNA polymerase sigma-70 factor (ECF subfamily)
MTAPAGIPLPNRFAQADPSDSSPGGPWLALFHRGDRATLEACYREHFATVERAIGPILGGADRETIIHELFSRLIGGDDLRRSFQGGSFVAWLATVARNQAIDYRRRLGRETNAPAEDDQPGTTANWEQAAEARLLVEQFRRERLPPAWHGVFELRFLQQLPQREAALRLKLHRTTLAYRELRIRRLLKVFLTEEDKP